MVTTTLKEHLQYHRDVVDKDMNSFRILLVGEHGDDGLVATVREVKTSILKIGVPIIILLILDIVSKFITR